jgi:hypothetical protein
MRQCASCEVVYINGIRCHEHGCPDAYLDQVRECKWCGSEFHPLTARQEFCDDSCRRSYNGLPDPDDQQDDWQDEQDEDEENQAECLALLFGRARA